MNVDVKEIKASIFDILVEIEKSQRGILELQKEKERLLKELENQEIERQEIEAKKHSIVK